MRPGLARYLVLFFVAAGLPATAGATPISYQFTATVDTILDDGSGVLAASGVSVGSTMTGTVSWDEAAATCFSSDCMAFYNANGPTAWFTLTNGVYSLASGNIQIIYTSPSAWVFDWPGDIWGTVNGLPDYCASCSTEYVTLNIHADDGATLPAGDTVLGSFDPAIFDTGTFVAGSSYAYHTGFDCTISDIRSVPEPASLLLMAAGIGIVALIKAGVERSRRRGRRRSA